MSDCLYCTFDCPLLDGRIEFCSVLVILAVFGWQSERPYGSATQFDPGPSVHSVRVYLTWCIMVSAFDLSDRQTWGTTLTFLRFPTAQEYLTCAATTTRL